MAGKFLQIWSLRSVVKSLAVLIIITIAVIIYATREIPDGYEDNKEWEFCRNIDFAMCIISLAFACVLLYGSITEFRMFLLLWMIWNVILTVFWIVFLARKNDELVRWERIFRLIAILLMVFAEIPVFNYFRFLRKNFKDPESNCHWTEPHSDKAYKNLSPRSSLDSVNSVFAGQNKPGLYNQGFRSDSVISVASEETEGNSEKEEQKDKGENETKERSDEKQEETDSQSQTSFEIAVTVHSLRSAQEDVIELPANEPTDPEIQNSQKVPTTSEVRQSTSKDAQGISSSNTVDQTEQIVAEKSDESNSDVAENETTSSANITEETAADLESSPVDSVVIAETKDEDIHKLTHIDSVSVEIDVTDVQPTALNLTSF